MKELSVEEKAKAYDEALERARDVYTYYCDDREQLRKIENIFPELKESEDERIRKSLIDMLKNDEKCYLKEIAWLEKQGSNEVKLTISDEGYNKAFQDGIEEVLTNPQKYFLEKQSEQKIQRCGVSCFTDIVQAIRTIYNEESAHDLIEYLTDLVNRKEQKPADKVEPKFEIKKGRNYRCTKTHIYAGLDWLEGTKYYADEDYSLVNNGCTCFCPKHSKYEHNNLFEEVECDGCIEKQGEQKHADKVEPKFKVGDWVIDKQGIVHQIANVMENVTYHTYGYDIVGGGYFNDNTEGVRLWTIQDTKDGDVLTYNDSRNNVYVCIFKEYANERVYDYCTLDKESFWEHGNWNYLASFSYTPATKEQRDLLFQKMKEAGYEWDAEKKELKKTEQKSTDLFKGEDYGINGLYAAVDILQKTLGKVDGYQTDDGILEHECAISAVKSLYEQKPAWSEEDKDILFRTINDLKFLKDNVSIDPKYAVNITDVEREITWLKSLKDRVQPQPKQEWSEEDESMRTRCIGILGKCYMGELPTKVEEELNWLKSLKERCIPRPEQEWSEDDENRINRLIAYFEDKESFTSEDDVVYANWLKSIRPQSQWKPSATDIQVLKDVIDRGRNPINYHATLHGILEHLKKLKEE